MRSFSCHSETVSRFCYCRRKSLLLAHVCRAANVAETAIKIACERIAWWLFMLSVFFWFFFVQSPFWLLYLILTTRISFWPINYLKVHLNLQVSTLFNAVYILFTLIKTNKQQQQKTPAVQPPYLILYNVTLSLWIVLKLICTPPYSSFAATSVGIDDPECLRSHF